MASETSQKVTAGSMRAQYALLLSSAAGILLFTLFNSVGAVGGDFSLDFVAAAPSTYHQAGPGEGNETSAGALEFDARAIGILGE